MSDLKLTNRDMEIISKAFQCFQSADAMKIDTEKLAQLAGFSNGKSANASWLVIKKKLMSGATVDAGATTSTSKKAKGKAAANGDVEDDDEATASKAAPKKRGKAIKTEPADAEGGDADTEKTPSAESPKKGRARKGTIALKSDVNGNADNDAAATETTTHTPKRKRGPNKPKDAKATPAKRVKKGANAATTTATGTNNDETKQGGSIFGGDTGVKKEEGDDRPFDAEEKEMMANDALMLNAYTEDQVA